MDETRLRCHLPQPGGLRSVRGRAGCHGTIRPFDSPSQVSGPLAHGGREAPAANRLPSLSGGEGELAPG